VEGFIVWNFVNRFANARSELSKWVAEKKIKFREHILEGLAAAPAGLRMLFTGENHGKLLIQMQERPRL
jgi:NADPH-dependent curcumin reductase CurA